MIKVYAYSLGCDKNEVDLEVLLGGLIKSGFEVVQAPDEADLIIVNTCCFIEEAKKESIDTLFEAIANKRDTAKVVVTGCMATRYADALKEQIPELDLVVPQDPREVILGLYDLEDSGEGDRYTTGRASEFLKIAEGCSKNCSYCIIPKLKGPYRSFGKDELVQQAKDLKDKGVKELILVAQDLTPYGRDIGTDLSSLLKELDNLNFSWIRLLYLYPEGISIELLKTIRESRTILPYFDIPIQHTSDKILKAMGRKTSKEKIFKLIETIREILPEAVIRSTVITGFPGETEEDFNELLEDLKELSLDRLGCFSYSREEDTPAYGFTGQIDEATKQARKGKIERLQSRIMRDRNGRFKDRVFDCLIEEKIDETTYEGRIYADTPEVDCVTYVDSEKNLKLGEFVKVKINDILDFELLGELYEFTE